MIGEIVLMSIGVNVAFAIVAWLWINRKSAPVSYLRGPGYPSKYR